jgi:4-alpha-glucanotransferase
VRRLELIIVIHNHQPVGNFDFVVEDAYQRSYLPFLELLERRPEVKIGLHNSGCLWEWLEGHHPEYGLRIAPLVQRGQVELLGGGFYEPILPIWPQRDRRGQIARMTRFLAERFNVRPRGMWLAERVWETHLAADLEAEGVEYLCLDDSQFLQVGLRDEELKGYFLTEDSGATVGLYPIQMQLRYEIPFAAPEQVIETLRASADDAPGAMRLFGDDGEKFGVWPGTHKLCYEEMWLDRFFDRVRDEGSWLRLVLPSEHRSSYPPTGRIYLPAGSYREMTEWALPPRAQILFDETKHLLRDAGRGEAEELLLRGGFFRNFLVRYPESNRMHKRSLLAHGSLDLAEGLDQRTVAEIRDHLWRAQCNCAYWHGVFGGLYLPHLRDAIYREILLGEEKLERAVRGDGPWVEGEVTDYDGDGHEEVILRSDRLAIFISPHQGGAITEIDDRTSHKNLVNGLARRPEAYHAKIGSLDRPDDGAVRTIHDAVVSKEEHLERYLSYDRSERLCLTDHLMDGAPTPDGMIDGRDLGGEDLAGGRYLHTMRRSRGMVEIVLTREGVLGGSPEDRVSLRKAIRLRAGVNGFEVAYSMKSLSPRAVHTCFGVEWLVNLLAGHAPDRYVMIDGRRPDDPDLAGMGAHDGGETFSLVDHWSEVQIDLQARGAAGWVRAPLQTVSLSESGAERVFQGTIAMAFWDVRLDPGAHFETTIGVRISNGREIGESRTR